MNHSTWWMDTMLIFHSARLRKDTLVNKSLQSIKMHSHSWDDIIGVVTFCRNSASPLAAEEGLTGMLCSGNVEEYGDLSAFTEEEVMFTQ